MVKFVEGGTDLISHAGVISYGIKNVKHESIYDHDEVNGGYLKFILGQIITWDLVFALKL